MSRNSSLSCSAMLAGLCMLTFVVSGKDAMALSKPKALRDSGKIFYGSVYHTNAEELLKRKSRVVSAEFREKPTPIMLFSKFAKKPGCMLRY